MTLKNNFAILKKIIKIENVIKYYIFCGFAVLDKNRAGEKLYKKFVSL